MNEHIYTIEVIGEMLEHFELQANEVKRAIRDSIEEGTITKRESYIFLSIFTEFVRAQDDIISKILAKELMQTNATRKQSDTIN